MEETHSEIFQKWVRHPLTGAVYPVLSKTTSEVEISDETTRLYHILVKQPMSCGCFGDEPAGFCVCDPPCLMCKIHYKFCMAPGCEKGLGPCCSNPVEIDGILITLCPACHEDYQRDLRRSFFRRIFVRIFLFPFFRF